MDYDVAIVGGGIAGLTAAAYLSAAGYNVAVFEKEDKVGGLVNSFDYKGYRFDGGIRAIESSGIVLPMLRQLGLNVEFIRNSVSIGLEKEMLTLTGEDSLWEYKALLERQFPQSKDDIGRIITSIRRVMDYMRVLYGIDNPLFLDLKKDKEYLYKTIIPWLFKYIFTIRKIKKFNMPIDEYLRTMSGNQTLIDMIAQHFFKKTPAFFALSYFSLYLDYLYPKGGTGVLVERLLEYINAHGGQVLTGARITGVDPGKHELTDAAGSRYGYGMLVWAADLKSLYRMINADMIINPRIRRRIQAQQEAVKDKVGGDSILTMFLTADLHKSYFEALCSPHFFYTPVREGLGKIPIAAIREPAGSPQPFRNDKSQLFAWAEEYLRLTTYEIAIPVMRDESLAPIGKTGLIISTLFDYPLVKHLSAMGWYDEFKALCADKILNVLDASVFPGLKCKVIDRFVSTPMTLEKKTGNSDGGITGWAFTNPSIPVENDLPRIARSIQTPIPDVLQAGQWAFSPSGLPTSVLTGKLAADRVKKRMKPGGVVR